MARVFFFLAYKVISIVEMVYVSQEGGQILGCREQGVEEEPKNKGEKMRNLSFTWRTVEF